MMTPTAAPAPALALVPPAAAGPVVAPHPALALARRRPALLVFAVALLARVAVLALFSRSPHFGVQSGDMRFYHDWALRIADGQWTDHHAFYGLPGYAYLLAAIYKLFGVHPAIILTLQAVADSATAALIFLLTRRVLTVGPVDLRKSFPPAAPSLASGEAISFPAEIFPALAAAGWIFFIPAQAFSAILMPTVLVVACYWFCVYQASLEQPAGRVGRWLGFGAMIGLAATFVATVLFAVPLLLLRARRVGPIALLLAGVALGSSPAWLHNRFVAHEPVLLSAHGGINFWVGNAPGANGYPKIPAGLRSGQQELLDDSISVAEQASGHTLTRAEVSRYWSARAWANIQAQPAVWAALLAVKVRNFWNAFSYDDVTVIALLREEGVLLPGIGFGVVAMLGLAGFLAAAVPNRPGRWVAAAVLLQMLALLPVFITERYRLGAVPGLLVLGACALDRIRTQFRARQWRGLLASGAMLGAAAAIVHLPVPDHLLSSMEPFNLAISELEVGQLDRAETHLAQAQALAPHNASILFSRGNLSLKRGEPERAKEFYRQTLAQNPRHAEAYANLGVIACGEKRWAWAVRFFRASLAIAPGDAQTQKLLAFAESQLSPP